MSKSGPGFSKAERAIIYGKSITNVSKHVVENINPQEEKATKKRKFQEEEEQEAPKETGTRRLKKLKDVSKEEELNEKVTIKLPKEDAQPKLISYEEQAKSYEYASDKLDKFKFADSNRSSLENKKADKFKFADDSKKNVKTLDAWKNQTDSKTKEQKPEVKEVKKEEKKEDKKLDIDPMTYFTMLGAGASKKALAEVAKVNNSKQTEMEVEELVLKEVKNGKTRDTPIQTSNASPAKSVQSETPATIQQISNLTLEDMTKKREPEIAKKVENEPVKEYAKEPAKVVPQSIPEKAKPTPKETVKKPEYRPLVGLAFTIVGVMDSVSVKELSEIIIDFGGSISEEVTEDVHALVIGSSMEDGSDVRDSPQYEAANWLDTRVYTETEFDEFLFTKTGKTIRAEVQRHLDDDDYISNEPEIITPTPKVEQAIASKPKTQPVETTKMIEEISVVKTPVNNFFAQNSGNKSQAKPAQVQQPKAPSIVKRSAPELLWTDKYAPKNIGEIIGNQDMVRNLMTWLKDWEDVVIHGNKKAQKFDGRQGKDNWGQSNLNAKACLVSGPPGIGKTTSVRLIARTMGYEIVEQNASDVRNKSAVEGHLNHLTDNALVSFSGTKTMNKKFLIIMDEVDGMSSGDRGGNQVLINAIKNTKTPIICVCNDRQHPKVRSLANHCYDLRYQRPQKNFVAKRMKEIIGMEKLNVDLTTLEYLCENFGNDIRQLINFLQMHAKRSNTLSLNDTKGSFHKVKKDQTVMMNNFDAAKILMNGNSDLPLRDKIDLFFIDYDLIPLLVQENYVPNNPRASNEDLERVAVAADMISTGDILSRSIRNNGEWGLLPNFAFIGSIFPCEIVNPNIGYPKFPEWLGKNSSQRKRQREVRELRALTSPAAYGATTQGVLFDYAKGLVDLLNYNLQTVDKDNIEGIVEIMDHYSISPDVIKEHLADIPFPPCKDPLSAVPTQLKTALTRSYNAKHKSSIKATKSKKTATEEGGAKRFNALAEEEEGGEASDVEEEEGGNEEEDTKMEVEATKPSTAQKASKGRGKGKDSKATSAKKTK